MYAIKEMHHTIQGEGFFAGRPAVFVRFAGCNVWSGNEKTRERDSKKGLCAMWCDTDFVGIDGKNGGQYNARDLVEKIAELWESVEQTFVVFTGGEPTLQWDRELYDACKLRGFFVAMETNGSNAIPESVRPDWVTLSPKPPMSVKPQRFNELKVVYPAVRNPLEFKMFVPNGPWYLQPLAGNVMEYQRNLDETVRWVLDHPTWRVSLQTHKYMNIP